MRQEEHIVPKTKSIGSLFANIERPTSSARNAKEALIEDIVAKCHCRSEKEAQTLKKRIAIWLNTTKADETDLHALLQKHRDPSVRNYGGLVNYLIKIRRAK